MHAETSWLRHSLPGAQSLVMYVNSIQHLTYSDGIHCTGWKVPWEIPHPTKPSIQCEIRLQLFLWRRHCNWENPEKWRLIKLNFDVLLNVKEVHLLDYDVLELLWNDCFCLHSYYVIPEAHPRLLKPVSDLPEIFKKPQDMVTSWILLF